MKLSGTETDGAVDRKRCSVLLQRYPKDLTIMKHIAVIGAGITGVTTACALLDRGYAVTA
jgi:heterodisulfide reductase subunit A-like polyferredoxin